MKSIQLGHSYPIGADNQIRGNEHFRKEGKKKNYKKIFSKGF